MDVELTDGCAHGRAPLMTYNTAPHFDAQVHSILPDHLLELGHILAKHRMHTAYRAFLIHRHQDLHGTMSMVHTYPDAFTDICQPAPLERCCDESSHSPFSYRFFKGRGMEPFEYVQTVDTAPSSPECWEDVGDFLQRHGLEDVLGVSRAMGHPGLWVEYQHESGSGTFARIESDERRDLAKGVPTEWAFYWDEGILRYKTSRECKPPPEGGGHVRTTT